MVITPWAALPLWCNHNLILLSRMVVLIQSNSTVHHEPRGVSAEVLCIITIAYGRANGRIVALLYTAGSFGLYSGIFV